MRPGVVPHVQATAIVALVWLVAAALTVLGGGCHFAMVFHQPCPGCGMTRALLLLARGELRASLALQPLAAPALCVQLALVCYTLWATWHDGSPWRLWQSGGGRFLLGLLMLTGAACAALWLARFYGAWGGPVSI